jgi:hypothetical protein
LDEISRHLWGYWDICIDQNGYSYEIVPRRDVAFHLNARRFLEEGPCFHCLNILGVQPSGHGSLLVDVELKHPFMGLNVYTGFDVRGIAIFPGSRPWPANGLVTSESDLGEGELLNPDGYTRLFNPLEYPPGSGAFPILEYSHGKYASADPETTLNAFKVYYSSENRRFFSSWESVTVTYDIKKPGGPILFGYAVDACWKPPIGGAPIDVPEDFEISANCPEAYQISAAQLTQLYQGGSCQVRIDVYDWQGTETINGVFLEAPDLFSGLVDASMIEDNGNWARYQATMWEEKSADTGDYDCLIRVDDVYGDPNFGDASAYTMFQLSVATGGELTCKGNLFLIADGNTLCDPMGEDHYQLMTNMIMFDAGPGEFADADTVKFYNGHHGKFNSILHQMESLVSNLGFSFVKSAEVPIEIEGCRMIVIYEPGFHEVDLFTVNEVVDLLHFLHSGGRMLLASDYTKYYYRDKTTLNDLLAQMGCTVYDDAYTHLPPIWVTDLADCPVMEGVVGIGMAANTRFILGPEDKCLGYSEAGGGVMFCSTKHYN